MNVTVVGIGAMGGGMARALLDSGVTSIVVGYDKSTKAVEQFYAESQNRGKAASGIPTSLGDAITEATNVVVISLVNEEQCEAVCFGGEENLLKLVPKGSSVVLTSTVTATWAQKADATFRASGIMFVDCPVSGGPARARQGDLTLMASGEASCLEFNRPVLDALAREVHVIRGGAGAGSTVKCVHQLLAGVHICAAAEAMAMAAKAGIDVSQLYEIVNGAAGASWMFTDRGKRMLEEDPDVNSALAIFVKDLDIVYAEAKKLMSPIPVATAALQQFISGQSLGLGKLDDSQVVKVYENVTKVPVAGASKVTMAEKRVTCIENEYIKVTKTTQQNSVGVSCSSATADSVRLSLERMLVEVQFTNQVPISNVNPASNATHEMIWEADKVRVYKRTILAGESIDISYRFFYLIISMEHVSMNVALLTNDSESSLQWAEKVKSGEIGWHQPTFNQRVTNGSGEAIVQYIVELR